MRRLSSNCSSSPMITHCSQRNKKILGRQKTIFISNILKVFFRVYHWKRIQITFWLRELTFVVVSFFLEHYSNFCFHFCVFLLTCLTPSLDFETDNLNDNWIIVIQMISVFSMLLAHVVIQNRVKLQARSKAVLATSDTY